MRRLIYNAPAHHVLQEGGEDVPGGGEFAVSNSRAEQLLADRTVSVFEAPDSDLANLKREELDAIAEQAGVESPAELPNKQAVLDAIAETETISQPEADQGEGHDTTPQED